MPASKLQVQQQQDPHPVGSAERTRNRPVYTPRVDILETEQAIVLKADMPGVNEKTVNITLENGVLTIDGSVEWAEPKDYELVYSEFDVGDFRRVFTLSEAIDQSRIEARVSNGVLSLTLPKAEEAKPRQITVKAG